MSWHRDAQGLWCPCFLSYQPDNGDGCPAHLCPENTELSVRLQRRDGESAVGAWRVIFG